MKKVLIVSGTSFRTDTNMGKTLISFFKNYKEDEIAQIYLRNEKPNYDGCSRYYMLSEKEILDNLFNKENCGKVMKSEGEGNTLNRSGAVRRSKLMQLSAVRFIRDLIWKTNVWKNNKLKNFIEEFSPEAIFFIMPYSDFPAIITKWISDTYKIPAFMFVSDDYYRNIKTSLSPFYYMLNAHHRKVLQKMRDNIGAIFPCSEKASDLFSKLFNKPSYTLFTPAVIPNIECEKEDSSDVLTFRYFGNVGLKRWETLVSMAKTLDKINEENKIRRKGRLEIYSSIDEQDIINAFNACDSCEFKGFISGDDYWKKVKSSPVVIHVESFDKVMARRTELSISTKIADYLGMGKCIFAIGPEHLASLLHIKDVSIQVNDLSNMKTALENLLNDDKLIETLEDKATELCKKDHDIENITALISQVIENN